MHKVFLFLIFGFVVAATGCGGDQLSYAPVEGTLTVDGTPIANAQVVLSCDTVTADGPMPASRGRTDDSGRFALMTITPDKRVIKGAVVGDHHVAIATEVLEQDSRGKTVVARKELLGENYTSGGELKLTVPKGGVTDVQFDLKSK